MRRSLLLIGCAFALTACLQETVIKDEAYFRAHQEERDQKIVTCAENAVAIDNEKECAAAFAAEEIKPVSYWKAHPEERKEKIEMCSEHRAALETNGNCINALEAARRSSGRGTPVYVQPG